MPLKVKTVRSGGVIKKVVKTTTVAVSTIPSQAVQNSETSDLPLKTADNNNNSTIVEKKFALTKFKEDLDKSKNVDENDNKKKINVTENENVLLVGDIVWSKIPGHCWWPSMISYDPVDAVFCTKLNGNGSTKFHVQFFGDKSLRGWVFKSSIIKFEGII